MNFAVAACDVLFNTERVDGNSLEKAANFCFVTFRILGNGKQIKIIHKDDPGSNGKDCYRVIDTIGSCESLSKRIALYGYAIISATLIPAGLVFKPLSFISKTVRKENYLLIQLKIQEAENDFSSGTNNETNEFPFNYSILVSDIKQEISKNILNFSDLIALHKTSKDWGIASIKQLDTVSIMQIWKDGAKSYMDLPVLSLTPFRNVGTDDKGTMYLQKKGTSDLLTKIDFIQPANMGKKHPIMRFLDPWGRIGLLIRYWMRTCNGQNEIQTSQHVLILHSTSSNIKSPWTSASKCVSISSPCYKSPNEYLSPSLDQLFPTGWETNKVSIAFLKRLMAGAPCGLPLVTLDKNSPSSIKVAEGPKYLNNGKKSFPAIILWKPEES